MLADTPKIDGSTRGSRPRPEGLPVRRMGLEQEFFLVDRKGELCDLADLFLWKCREAARAIGSDPGASLTRDEGLSLVREACRRMNEQVSSLCRRYDEALPGDEHDPEVARVISIRSSPTFSAKEAHPARVHNAQASVGAANGETA
jgi:hypothetical protein